MLTITLIGPTLMFPQTLWISSVTSMYPVPATGSTYTGWKGKTTYCLQSGRIKEYEYPDQTNTLSLRNPNSPK